VKLWTPKFMAGLAFLVLFLVNARWNPENETTGVRPPLLPFTDQSFFSTLFSFAFLLIFLFVVSHAGSWVLWKLRHRGKVSEDSEPAKGRRKRRRKN